MGSMGHSDGGGDNVGEDDLEEKLKCEGSELQSTSVA